MIVDASTKTASPAAANRDMLIAHMQSTMGCASTVSPPLCASLTIRRSVAGAPVPPVLDSSAKTPFRADRKIVEQLPAYHAAKPPQYTAPRAAGAPKEKDFAAALAKNQSEMGFIGAPIVPDMTSKSTSSSSFKFASLFKKRESKPLDLALVNETSSLRDRQRLAEVNWPTLQRGQAGR